MQLYKVKDTYIIRGHYNNIFMSATAQTARDALKSIFEQIAIIRSLIAWNK